MRVFVWWESVGPTRVQACFASAPTPSPLPYIVSSLLQTPWLPFSYTAPSRLHCSPLNLQGASALRAQARACVPSASGRAHTLPPRPAEAQPLPSPRPPTPHPPPPPTSPPLHPTPLPPVRPAQHPSHPHARAWARSARRQALRPRETRSPARRGVAGLKVRDAEHRQRRRPQSSCRRPHCSRSSHRIRSSSSSSQLLSRGGSGPGKSELRWQHRRRWQLWWRQQRRRRRQRRWRKQQRRRRRKRRRLRPGPNCTAATAAAVLAAAAVWAATKGRRPSARRRVPLAVGGRQGIARGGPGPRRQSAGAPQNCRARVRADGLRFCGAGGASGTRTRRTQGMRQKEGEDAGRARETEPARSQCLRVSASHRAGVRAAVAGGGGQTCRAGSGSSWTSHTWPSRPQARVSGRSTTRLITIPWFHATSVPRSPAGSILSKP